MLRRPLAACAAALATIAVVVLPAAGPADAAGTCTLTAPARITIYAEDTDLPADITGDCRPYGYGTWLTPGVDDYAVAFYDYELDFAGHLLVPDKLDTYGRQYWFPFEAGTYCDASRAAAQRSPRAADAALTRTSIRERRDHRSSTSRTQADCQDLTQNQPSSDIRLGGYASLTATRSGSRVTFTAGSGGWSPASHKLAPRPNISGEIQTQYADGTWRRVGNPLRTGSNAKATVSYTLASARTYRFAIYSTASYFDRVSNPITR